MRANFDRLRFRPYQEPRYVRLLRVTKAVVVFLSVAGTCSVPAAWMVAQDWPFAEALAGQIQAYSGPTVANQG